MVEVYVFHHSHLLCLISFRNLARSFLNLLKFSVVGCFLALLKAWWLSFCAACISSFHHRVGCFFFLLSLLFFLGRDASCATALMIDSSVSIALFRLVGSMSCYGGFLKELTYFFFCI